MRKLKREQELHSTRFCEILEQRNKLKDELDGRNNEVQNKTLQLENLIDQVSHTNDKILNLRSEIESTREELRSEKEINLRLVDDLNTEKQINEGMLKSQEDLNQLYERNLHRQKGKAGLGYKEEGESSKQGTKRNQKPTCNHCGKIGHTSNKCWNNEKAEFNGKFYSCNQPGHKANECKEKPRFRGNCHKCNKQGHKASEYRSKTFNPVEQIVKAMFASSELLEGKRSSMFSSTYRWSFI